MLDTSHSSLFGPTNRILSAVSPRVKVEKKRVGGIGEHCGRNSVGRNRGGAMGIEWNSRLALSDGIEGFVRLKVEDVIRLFMRHNPLMRTSTARYHRHRFPAEIISHCVWLYFRFTLSFRDVEELISSRGVYLTYETVREWCLKFGQTYANGLRHKSPRPGDRWHLDEMFLKINGRLHYLWRAVDQDGDVLDILVQSRRDKKAAKKFFRKLLKGLRYVPR